MQVTEHVHAVKIPFVLEVAPGKRLNRFVYVYLIYEDNSICLIDCGVAGSKEVIFDYIIKTGRSPEEIATAVITHAHPDHIGGGPGIQKAVNCKTAAHIEAVRWIEDTELQFNERPVPGFHDLVEGPFKIDFLLYDEDRVETGGGKSLTVIYTPGHSKGHISLFYEADNVLFSGDCVPLPGEIPIYEDVFSSIKSLVKLQNIKGMAVLLSSWDEPRYGDSGYEVLKKGLACFQEIHSAVLNERISSRGSDANSLALYVIKTLGLPEIAMNPVFLKTVEAHLQLSRYPNLFEIRDAALR
jgi:glyoxylase-like metal-dependent hydrolase (beta-lactamase superfamily II)